MVIAQGIARPPREYLDRDSSSKAKEATLKQQMQTKHAIILAFLVVGMLLLAGSVLADRLPRDLAPAAGAAGQVANDQSVWNSGWVTIAAGETRNFVHNLGGDPGLYATEIWFRDTRTQNLGIHHRAYGGMDIAGQQHGLHWENLTDTSVDVVRHADDVAIGQVYLRIWQLDPPAYDSEWQDIGPGRSITLTHGLGGDVDDYTVGVRFRETGPDGRGIHLYAIGGMEVGGEYHGAAWQQVTDSTIRVLRFGADPSAQQIRVFIDLPSPPAFDSGWQDVARDETQVVTHNLGGNVNTYIVRVSSRSTAEGGLGVNTRGAGGLEVDGRFMGANWERLTNATIDLFRRRNDVFADQMRVRIWRPYNVFVPMVVSNHATPIEIAYDDGSAESSQSWIQGYGFAVRFSAPSASTRLVGARYFFMGPVAPIEVHVWDADRNDLMTPFTATPTSDGWFDVDLSGQNVTVSGDFYVGYLHTVDVDPTLGVDTSSPEARSYEVPWEEKSLDYMIRAVVSQQ